jgi:hypothetical protein
MLLKGVRKIILAWSWLVLLQLFLIQAESADVLQRSRISRKFSSVSANTHKPLYIFTLYGFKQMFIYPLHLASWHSDTVFWGITKQSATVLVGSVLKCRARSQRHAEDVVDEHPISSKEPRIWMFNDASLAKLFHHSVSVNRHWAVLDVQLLEPTTIICYALDAHVTHHFTTFHTEFT